MPLQPNFVEMPLIKGLDTKTDPKQVPLGKLLEAENVVFNRPGRIEKRNGFTALSKQVIDTGNEISIGRAIANYKEELTCFDEQNFYSYIEGTNAWKDKGDFISSYITKDPVTNGTATDSEQDSAYHDSGITCVVFKSNDGFTTKLYYSILDVASGQTVISKQLIAASASNPRVITFNNSFVIYYKNNSNNRIYAGILPIGAIGSTITFTPITGTGNNNNTYNPSGSWDVKVITTYAGQSIYFVFGNNNLSGAKITLRRYTTNPLSFITQVVVDTIEVPNQLPIALELTHELYYDAVLLSIVNVFISNEYFIIAPTLDDGSGAANILKQYANAANQLYYNITSVSKSKTELQISSYYGFEFGPPGNTIFAIQHADITLVGGNIVYAENLSPFYNCSLISRALTYQNQSYVCISGAPDGQITHYLIDEKFNPIARFYSKIGLENLSFFIPSINQVSDTQFFFACRSVTQFSEIGGTTLTNITKVGIEFFNPERSYARDEIADNLYVGGGMLYSYDGISLVEDNFNWYPSGSATPVSGSGSNSYAYRFTYEWVDNWGNVHISAPSDDIRVTIANPIGVSGSKVELYATSQNLTYKKPSLGRNPIIICAYRTEAGGSDYYKLPVTTANVNDTAYWTTALPDDTTTDAELVGYAPLYTNGDPAPLEHDAPPPIGALVVHRNRIFALDSTNPLLIYYTTEYSEDAPPSFSDGFTIQVDPYGGPVTGLASLDDKLVIFKENSIRYITGQGPDLAGQNNDYTAGTVLITSDCGCSNIRSIVSTPDGVMFKSNKGIMILNRGLQVLYIGNSVERYNDATVTSAVLSTKLNQVRFTLDTGICLVYDYFIQAWTVFTNMNNLDSVIWNNKHTYIRSSGQVLTEQAGTYVDQTSAIPMKISTTWLQFSGIQGFQRLWKFYILGNWKSPHQLKVNLYYDYNEAYSQEIIVNPAPLTTYGTGNYGNESPYGGEFALYQYEVRPARQKCMTMKVVISDIPSGSVALGASCDISNLRFEYGVEGKGNRLKDASIAG